MVQITPPAPDAFQAPGDSARRPAATRQFKESVPTSLVGTSLPATSPVADLPEFDDATLALSDVAGADRSPVPEPSDSDAHLECAAETYAALSESSGPWLAWGVAGAAMGASVLATLLYVRGQNAAAPSQPAMAISDPAPIVDSAATTLPLAEQGGSDAERIARRGAQPTPEVSPDGEAPETRLDDAASLSGPQIDEKSVDQIGDAAELDKEPNLLTAPPLPPLAAPLPDDDSENPTPDESVPHESALTIDPLDIDPEGLNLASLSGGRPPRPTWSAHDDEQTQADAIPPAIPEPPSLGESAREELPLGGPSLATSAVLRDPTSSPAMALPDGVGQLEQTVSLLTVDKMPLSEFLGLITQLSGTPLSASPEELRLAAIDPRHEISLDQGDGTFGQLLPFVLGPLRLGVEPRGAQWVIRRQGLAPEREIAYPIDDLTQGGATAEMLAAWLRQFVAPDAWHDDASQIEIVDDTLRVTQAERVQYEVLFFLERLRLCRGLNPKSRFPVKLLPPESAESLVASTLSTPVTFTFSQFTPLAEVIDYWQEKLGMAILVDWPALEDHGLRPRSRIACRAIAKPWSVAMDDVLTPLELGWRATGASSLEITSRRNIDRTARLAWYRLKSSRQNDVKQWQTQIDAWAEQIGAEAVPGTSVALDVDSNTLIVRHVASVLRLLSSEVSTP